MGFYLTALEGRKARSALVGRAAAACPLDRADGSHRNGQRPRFKAAVQDSSPSRVPGVSPGVRTHPRDPLSLMFRVAGPPVRYSQDRPT